MNESKFAQQLVGELPSLVSRNVIDAASAEALRRHYEPQARATASRAASIGLAISAILGGLLVGAGIILLIAHNWDDLSRPARAALALLPLVVSVALSGRTILRKMHSAAWREGCGVFWFLSIGASIALVSQTYHLYNDIAGFLLAWMLLALPLVYLLNSGAAFVGCLACVVAYTIAVNSGGGWGWREVVHLRTPLLLLATTLPFYAWHVWRRRESLMVTWLSWALAAAVLVMMPALIGFRLGFFGVAICHGMMCVVFYLAGRCWFGESRGWRSPFRSIGALGIALMAVSLTFPDGYQDLWESAREGAGGNGNVWTFLAVIYPAWLLLAAFAIWRRKYFNWAAACFPVMLALALRMPLAEWMPLLMSAYVLALGAFTLVSGVKRDSLFSMNEGAVLIAALVVIRFFSDDYSFVARGVAFIVIGCGFLAMNLFVMGRRRKVKSQTERKGGAA